MLKPKHSFQSVVTELVDGLRSGEIALKSIPELEGDVTEPLIEIRLAEQEFASFERRLKAQINGIATTMANRAQELIGERTGG